MTPKPKTAREILRELYNNGCADGICGIKTHSDIPQALSSLADLILAETDPQPHDYESKAWNRCCTYLANKFKGEK